MRWGKNASSFVIEFGHIKTKEGSVMSKFDQIIGYASTKEELRKISDTLKSRDCYDKLGVNTPRGLLLFGEPGVGKSLMAAAVIGESGRRAFVCRKDQPDGDFV